MSWLDSITNSVDMGLSKLWEMVMDRQASHATVSRMGLQRVGHDWATKQQQLMEKCYTYNGQNLESGLLCVFQATGNILFQRCKASVTAQATEQEG